MGAEMCLSGSRPSLAVRTWLSVSPFGGPSGAAPGCTWVRDTHAFIRSTLVLMLNIVGSCDEAIAAAPDAIDAAEATQNPYALSQALLAYGFACREAHPDRALDALRRGLVLAQESGNRNNESISR